MEKFQPKDKLKIFEFSKPNEIKAEIKANLMKFKTKLNDYKICFLQTPDLKYKNLYKSMGIF